VIIFGHGPEGRPVHPEHWKEAATAVRHDLKSFEVPSQHVEIYETLEYAEKRCLAHWEKKADIAAIEQRKARQHACAFISQSLQHRSAFWSLKFLVQQLVVDRAMQPIWSD
jgi:hypothetical protein